MNLPDSVCRTILDTLPIPVFVVNANVQIEDLNPAAAKAFAHDDRPVYKRLGGEVLHCLHSVAAGCGRSEPCRCCVIRNSVVKCFEGESTSRKWMNLRVVRGATHADVQVLITASALPGGDQSLALLMIEDISEVSTLRKIIPICMKCKKIRDDHQHWSNVDDYLHEHAGVDFSHGLCPVCVEEVYPQAIAAESQR